jgi:uncharacterized protein with FMN-binding domain
MRKVLLALLLTAVGLGLLLSFRSRSGAGPASATSLGGSALAGGSSTTTDGGAATPGPSASASASGTPSASPSGSKPGSTSSSGSKDGTFTGPAEPNPYGNVQVQAVVSGGKLTNVIVLQVPDRSGYEDQIVQIALPELKSEALSAQNANIDVVSGATYTSQGYAESLQSALEQAGLKG